MFVMLVHNAMSVPRYLCIGRSRWNWNFELGS